MADRFTALLNDSVADRAEYDQPLYYGEGWIVAPTLGAVIPNWLIILPRDYSLSFRHWHLRYHRNPTMLAGMLCDHLGLIAEDVIWFEHGPAHKGSTIGCGADYAHIHLILKPEFSFQTFLDQAMSMSSLEWQSEQPDDIYSSLPNEQSYLVAGSGRAAAWASNVESAGSQFFRRVVSSLSKQPDQWDYKRFSHEKNITQTIETFRNLESTNRLGR